MGHFPNGEFRVLSVRRYGAWPDRPDLESPSILLPLGEVAILEGRSNRISETAMDLLAV